MFEKHLNTSIFNCEELEMNISKKIVVLIVIVLAVTFLETKAIKSLGLFDMSWLLSANADHSDSILQKWIKLKTFFNLSRFWHLKITNVVFVRPISIQNVDLTLCVIFCNYFINNWIIRGDNAIGLRKLKFWWFPQLWQNIQFCSKLRQSLVNKLY